MDVKKWAVSISILVLLPLFLVLFVDALYQEPHYDQYCNYTYYYPEKAIPADLNCSYAYGTEYDSCVRSGGDARFKYNESGCQTFEKCDYCRKDFDSAHEKYNRNIFFILAPLGLIMIILGIYLAVDYIGAGLMFGGLITLFYSTIRYFSDLSKMLRAIVILVELVVIILIAYKKIEGSKNITQKESEKKKTAKAKKGE